MHDDSTIRTIPVGHGAVTLVDAEDYPSLASQRWCLSTGGYVCRMAYSPTRPGRRAGVRMHRFIMRAKNGQYVDHINGDKLDNRRSNLRVCSAGENARNSRVPRNNRSGYKGVCWHTAKGKWLANIMKDGRRYHLGYFDDAFVAALVYDVAARELHGEYARPNFTLADLIRICCREDTAEPET